MADLERSSVVTAPSARPVLRDANFLRLWIGETVSMLGSTISQFAIAIVAVVMLHATPGQMGLLRSLGVVPTIALGLFAGVWVDRFARRRLLVTLNVIAAVAVASVPVAYLSGALSLTQLFALSLVFGALDSFWEPAWGSFLPSVIERDRLVDANSKMTFSMSATGIAGPGIAGFLVQILTAPIAMVVDAASFVFAAISVGGVESRKGGDPSSDRRDAAPIGTRIREGLRVAFLDPMQRGVTAPLAILEFVNALSQAVYVIFVLRVVGLSPASLGAIFAVASVGFLVGSAVAPRIERRLRAGRAAILGLGLVAASPFTMVLASAEHPLWLNLVFLGVPGIVGGFGGIIQWVMLSSIRQAITPDGLLGRVYASVGVLGGVMTVAGALIGGALGETIGPRWTILAASLGYTVPFFWTLFGPVRDARTDPAIAEEASGAHD
jgi:MFS family permease